jgi:hypothetical protein
MGSVSLNGHAYPYKGFQRSVVVQETMDMQHIMYREWGVFFPLKNSVHMCYIGCALQFWRQPQLTLMW